MVPISAASRSAAAPCAPITCRVKPAGACSVTSQSPSSRRRQDRRTPCFLLHLVGRGYAPPRLHRAFAAHAAAAAGVRKRHALRLQHLHQQRFARKGYLHGLFLRAQGEAMAAQSGSPLSGGGNCKSSLTVTGSNPASSSMGMSAVQAADVLFVGMEQQDAAALGFLEHLLGVGDVAGPEDHVMVAQIAEDLGASACPVRSYLPKGGRNSRRG